MDICRVKGFAPRGQCANQNWPREAAGIYVATPLGFEPRITPPKGAVLPLHHGVFHFGFRIADCGFANRSAPGDARNYSADGFGKRISTVVPFPGTLAIEILPMWASTTALA